MQAIAVDPDAARVCYQCILGVVTMMGVVMMMITTGAVIGCRRDYDLLCTLLPFFLM